MKRRNGYSEMEIVQKREALENVLIPYRLEENKQLLRDTGFTKFDTFLSGTTSPHDRAQMNQQRHGGN